MSLSEPDPQAAPWWTCKQATLHLRTGTKTSKQPIWGSKTWPPRPRTVPKTIKEPSDPVVQPKLKIIESWRFAIFQFLAWLKSFVISELPNNRISRVLIEVRLHRCLIIDRVKGKILVITGARTPHSGQTVIDILSTSMALRVAGWFRKNMFQF